MELIATVALVCLCVGIGVRAGQDMALNWRTSNCDEFKATVHLKARTAAVVAAIVAPVLTPASWPVALFILAVGVFSLRVPSNRALEDPR